jgi:TetR/AcrR family transcriptional regulator
MVGDALVLENERLQQRMNQFFDKIEATLKQCLRDGATPDASLRVAILSAFLVGRLQRYVRSGFKQRASDQLEASLALLLTA